MEMLLFGLFWMCIGAAACYVEIKYYVKEQEEIAKLLERVKNEDFDRR